MGIRFLILALIIVAIAIVGSLTWYHYLDAQKGGIDMILALTLFAISISTFFGFLIIGSAPGAGWHPTKGGIRISIAA